VFCCCIIVCGIPVAGAAFTGALGSASINALIFTASVPFSVFVVKVIVLDVKPFPLPLNFAVNCAVAPGAKGSLLQSEGTVHPQVLLISLTTKGELPVFVYLNTVSTGVPSLIVPKSCSVSLNEIVGKFPALASLWAASATFAALILLAASSLQHVNAIKQSALTPNINFFIVLIFFY